MGKKENWMREFRIVEGLVLTVSRGIDLKSARGRWRQGSQDSLGYLVSFRPT